MKCRSDEGIARAKTDHYRSDYPVGSRRNTARTPSQQPDERCDLLLIDAGFETPNGYATDIRAWFGERKIFAETKEIYQIVLDSQLAAIDAIKPGVTFRAFTCFRAR